MTAHRKGLGYEWKVRDKFRALGYVYACTSRGVDRSLDAAGVDLANTGDFLVQCKAVERGLSAHKILDHMPNEKGKTRLMIHKRNIRKQYGGEVVSMYWADFEKLVIDANKARSLDNETRRTQED